MSVLLAFNPVATMSLEPSSPPQAPRLVLLVLGQQVGPQDPEAGIVGIEVDRDYLQTLRAACPTERRSSERVMHEKQAWWLGTASRECPPAWRPEVQDLLVFTGEQNRFPQHVGPVTYRVLPRPLLAPSPDANIEATLDSSGCAWSCYPSVPAPQADTYRFRMRMLDSLEAALNTLEAPSGTRRQQLARKLATEHASLAIALLRIQQHLPADHPYPRFPIEAMVAPLLSRSEASCQWRENVLRELAALGHQPSGHAR